MKAINAVPSAPIDSPDMAADTYVFAIADSAADADYTVSCLAANGQQGGSEGTGTSGYELSAADPNKARACIVRTLRFRTGDLRIFFLQHPRRFDRQIHPDDLKAYHEWRSALRNIDRAAKSATAAQ